MARKVRRRAGSRPMEILEKRVLLSGDVFVTVNNGSTGTIAEYDTSGNAVNTNVVTSSSLANPQGVAVIGNDIFVASEDNNTVSEYTTSGAAANASAVIATGLDSPIGIATDGTDAYVASENGQLISVYNTSGQLVTHWSTSAESLYPEWIAVSGGDVYVAGLEFNLGIGDVVAEFTTSGALVNGSLIYNLSGQLGIAASGSDLFIEDPNGISEYSTSGSLVQSDIVSSTDDFEDVAISGGDIYTTDFTTSDIAEYTTSGAAVNTALVTNLVTPHGIFVTQSAQSAPSAPTNVVATQGTLAHHVQITWDAAAGAANYQIYRATDNNFADATKIAGAITTTSYNDTTATPGVLYYYWVKGRNTTGIGAQSSSASGYIPLPGPANFVATDDPHHVQLTWAAVSGAAGYQVFRSTTNDINTATKIATGLTTLDFNDTTAVFGTTYYYWVRARNAVGVGLYSAVQSGDITA